MCVLTASSWMSWTVFWRGNSRIWPDNSCIICHANEEYYLNRNALNYLFFLISWHGDIQAQTLHETNWRLCSRLYPKWLLCQCERAATSSVQNEACGHIGLCKRASQYSSSSSSHRACNINELWGLMLASRHTAWRPISYECKSVSDCVSYLSQIINCDRSTNYSLQIYIQPGTEQSDRLQLLYYKMKFTSLIVS